MILHCVRKKGATIFLPLTLPDAGNFSKLFHPQTHTPPPFNCPFPELPGSTSARRNLLDLVVEGKVSEAGILTVRLGATPSETA